jgi:hypothetical protein
MLKILAPTPKKIQRKKFNLVSRLVPGNPDVVQHLRAKILFYFIFQNQVWQ